MYFPAPCGGALSRWDPHSPVTCRGGQQVLDTNSSDYVAAETWE